MATRIMSDIEFIKKLRNYDKSYFTIADLEKILGLKRDSLYVTLNRLVKAGVLIKLKRGVYQPEFQATNLGKVANELYYPSYLSFESALSVYGILSQIPYALMFATVKRSKRLTLIGREVEYRQLKKDYFFGYILKNGMYIAEPEKAVLDQLYMLSKGVTEADTVEWSLVGLEKKKFFQYSKKFPKKVQDAAKQLIPKFGKYVTTLDKKELFQAAKAS